MNKLILIVEKEMNLKSLMFVIFLAAGGIGHAKDLVKENTKLGISLKVSMPLKYIAGTNKIYLKTILVSKEATIDVNFDTFLNYKIVIINSEDSFVRYTDLGHFTKYGYVFYDKEKGIIKSITPAPVSREFKLPPNISHERVINLTHYFNLKIAGIYKLSIEKTVLVKNKKVTLKIENIEFEIADEK